jgi:hypothetical protein
MARFLKNPDLAQNSTAARLPIVPSSSYGDSPISGLIRFNQNTNRIEFYYNDTWNQVAKIGTVSIVVDEFTGDGVTTTFTMSQAESSDSAILVQIGGVYQQPTTNYTTDGSTTITFTSPPPAPGVNPNKIVVVHNLNSTNVAA